MGATIFGERPGDLNLMAGGRENQQKKIIIGFQLQTQTPFFCNLNFFKIASGS